MYQQQINIEVNGVCKIANSAFGKYVQYIFCWLVCRFKMMITVIVIYDC